MMATTGAVIVFSTFPGANAGRNRSLAASVLRKTIRMGCVFIEVGPNLAIS